MTGKDFWFMLPENSGHGGGFGGSDGDYQIFIVSQYCIENATIEILGSGVTQTFSVEPGEFYQYSVAPDRNVFVATGGAGGNELESPIKKGVHITSPQPVEVYMMNYSGASSDGETMLPTRYLGLEYIVSFRNNTGSSNYTYVTATEDNTDVTISTSSGFGPKTLNVNLDAGEVYGYSNSYNCNSDYSLGGITGSCSTGSKVTATKPVSVMSNIPCGNIGQCGNCDQMMATYLPIDKWNNEFVTTQVQDRLRRRLNVTETDGSNCSNAFLKGSGDYVEITALVGTNVTVNTNAGVNSYVIPANPNVPYGYGHILLENPENIAGGDFGRADCYISANNPMQVMQYNKGRHADDVDADGNDPTDPEALTVLPKTFWEDSYFFYPIRSASATSLNVVVILEDVGTPLPSTTIEINDVNVGPGGWTQIGSSNFYSKRISFPTFESSKIVSSSGAKFGFFFYSEGLRETSFFSGGYGALEELSLCEQCAEIGIDQSGATCEDEIANFKTRIYTFTEPTGLSYLWNFGDGNSSTLRDPQHTYTNGGSYPVTLTVDDGKGCVLTTNKIVNVNKVSFDLEVLPNPLCFGDTARAAINNLQLVPGLRQSVQYTNQTTMAIPDNSSLTSSIVVPTLPAGWSLDSVCLNIDHPKVEELQLRLLKGAANFILHTSPKTDGRSNYRKTCFTPAAATSITTAKAPFTGEFLPLAGTGMFTTLEAGAAAGTWDLRVTDTKNIFTGELLDWSIYISSVVGVATVDWQPTAEVITPTNTEAYFSPAITGNVSVEVTDFTGCSAQQTKQLRVERLPRLIASEDTIVCSNEGFLDLFKTLPAATTKTGTWVDLNGTGKLTSSLLNLSGLGTATYTFKYLVPIFCGNDSAVVKVTIGKLPNLGSPNSIQVCDNDATVTMLDSLLGTPELGGIWTTTSSLGATSFTSNGMFFNAATADGTYDFYYKKPVIGCVVDSVLLQIQLNSFVEVGKDSVLNICETATLIDLNKLLKPQYLGLGRWVDLNTTGGLNATNQTFSVDGLGGQNPVLAYIADGSGGCETDTAFFTVNIQDAPEVKLIPNTNIICKDSVLSITVNVVGGIQPFNALFKRADGKTFIRNGISDGFVITDVPNASTSYFDVSVADNTSLGCLAYKHDTLKITVATPISTVLIAESCIDAINFRATVEITGGDPGSYLATITATNGFSTTVPVTSNPFVTPLLPSKFNYTVTITDGSNCIQSSNTFTSYKDCDCINNPGTMNLSPKEYCEDATIVLGPATGSDLATSEPENYLQVYYLHDYAGILLGDKIDSNFAPIFTYKPTMTFGKTYYISSVVGIDNGSGAIDLTHRCTQVSRGTPIVFRENPELLSIGTDVTICEGDTAKIPVEVLGTAPFTFEFDTAATTGTFTVLNNIDTLRLAPGHTLNYAFSKITDGNASACAFSINPAEQITITVKEAPTVTLSGDNAICDGDEASVILSFTGDKPLRYTVRKKVNGTATSTTYTTSRTDTTFKTTVTTDFEVISAISANGCDAKALGGNFLVTVNGRPNADAGGNQTLCGLEGTLNANPSFGIGEWTSADPTIFFFDKNNPNTKVISSDYATKVVRWTEVNPPCPISFDEINLSFSLTPNANAGKDSSICGLTYKLQAIPSIGAGNWQYMGAGTAVFGNIFDPNTTVTVADPGTYKLVWRESFNNTCVDRDTVKLTFFGALKVLITDTICNYIDNTYQLKLAISGGQQSSYKVNGTLIGASNFTSNPILNGNPYSFQVYDNTSCDSVLIKGSFACPCISQAPLMSTDTIYACYEGIFSALHNAATVRDDNDTLIYVLHRSSVDTLGSIVSTSGTNKLKVSQADGLIGQIFYLSAVVGNKTNQFFGLDRTDPCLSVAVGTPVKIVQKTQLFNNPNLKFCEGENAIIEFFTSRPTDFEVTLTGPNGTFTYTLGTSIGTNNISIAPPLGTSTYSVVNFKDLNNVGCAEIVNSIIKVTRNVAPVAVAVLDTLQCSSQAYAYRAMPSGYKGYNWTFDDGTILSGANVVYAHQTRGNKSLTLRVENNQGCFTEYTYDDTIFVQKTPEPDFTIDEAAPYCTNKEINFTFSGLSPDRSKNEWTFLNDTLAKNSNTASLTTAQKGDIVVKLTEYTSSGCKASISKTISIGGPSAKVLISDPWVCSGDTLEFGYNQAIGVTSVMWNFSDGQTTTDNVARVEVPNVSPSNFYYANLTLNDVNGCSFTVSDSVKVSNFDGKIDQPALDNYCLGDTIFHSASGTNIFSYEWRLGNGKIAYTANAGPQIYKQAGDYEVSVKIIDNDNVCNRTLVKKFRVNPLPVLLGPDTVYFCGDQEKEVRVSGAQAYRWLPSNYLSTTTEPNPIIAPEDDITYLVSGTDANGCTSVKTIRLLYDELEPTKFTSKDTTVVIGDTVYIDLPNDPRITYTWFPKADFKCPTCRSQALFSLDDVEYFVDISDDFGCYSDRYSIKITYLDKFSIDVPEGFTPNGDGINDVIFPRGWGVKDIEYFEIYNRWGDLIYTGTGNRPSWDGTFKGKEQVSDVYYYRVKAIIYGENTVPRLKEGTFRLIR